MASTHALIERTRLLILKSRKLVIDARYACMKAEDVRLEATRLRRKGESPAGR